MRTCRMRWFVLPAVSIGLFCSAGLADVDVTFFLAADTHFGYQVGELDNKEMITVMNDLPGESYPGGIGGAVGVGGGNGGGTVKRP